MTSPDDDLVPLPAGWVEPAEDAFARALDEAFADRPDVPDRAFAEPRLYALYPWEYDLFRAALRRAEIQAAMLLRDALAGLPHREERRRVGPDDASVLQDVADWEEGYGREPPVPIDDGYEADFPKSSEGY